MGRGGARRLHAHLIVRVGRLANAGRPGCYRAQARWLEQLVRAAVTPEAGPLAVLLDGKVLIPKTCEPHWAIGCLFMAGARGPLEVTEAAGSVRVVDLERETLRLIAAEDAKKRRNGSS